MAASDDFLKTLRGSPQAAQAEPAIATTSTMRTAEDFFKKAGINRPLPAGEVARQQQERIDALPEVTGAEGLFAGRGVGEASKVASLLAVTTDPREMGQIITSNFPEVGIAETPDGELIAVNNNTGKAASLNKPGLSDVDIKQGLATVLAFTPAGRTATAPTLGANVARVGGASAATQAAIEGAQVAGGGTADPEEVLIAGTLGGAGEAATPALQAVRNIRGGRAATPDEEATIAAQQAVEGLEQASGQRVGLFRGQQSLNPAQLDEQSFLSQIPATSRKAAQDLKKQNEEVFRAAASLVNRIGSEDALTQGAARLKTASQNAIDAAKKRREEKASPLFTSAFSEGTIPNVSPVTAQIDDLLLKLSPEDSTIAPTLKRVKKAIEAAVKPGEGRKNALERLHNQKLAIDDMIEGSNEVTGVGRNTKRLLVNIQENLIQQLEASSPLYATARQRFRELSPEVNAIESSVLSKIARVNDADLKRVSGLIFDATETNPNVVRNARSLIQKVDAEAWDDIIRVELQKRIGSLGELIEENPEAVPNTAAQLKRALFGSPAKRSVFMSALTPGQKNNFKFLENVLLRASRGRQFGSQTAGREQLKKELKGSPLAVSNLLFGRGNPLEQLGGEITGRVNDEVFNKNARILAEAAFSTEFGPKLARISGMKPDTPASFRAMTQLLDEIARSQEVQDQLSSSESSEAVASRP